MNKLMLIPIMILTLLSIFGMLYDVGYSFTGDSPDYQNFTGGVNGTSITIPGGGSTPISLTDAAAVMAIIVVAIAVVVASGVTVMGSGLSDNAQRVLFISVFFGALWAILTVFALDLIFVGFYLTIVYICLTIIYIIGLGMHISQGGSDA